MRRNGKAQLTVDREARDRLVEIINRYLNEQTSAFEFDGEMRDLECEVGYKNEDQTVRHVINLLWYFYDDCNDHLVVAEKEEWDYVQRLILLLKSDAHLQVVQERRWSIRQFIAALTLVLCVVLAWPFGIGDHLYLLIIPCGIVSLSLTASKRWAPPLWSSEEVARMPFTSFAHLRVVAKTVPDFVKQRHPKHVGSRTIRSRLANACSEISPYILQFIFSPIVLFFQMFPVSYGDLSVVTIDNP